MHKLMDYSRGLGLVQDRIDSGEWWILVITSRESAELALHLCDQFYTGENGHLFNLLCNPFGNPNMPYIALAFAAKSRMSAKQLSGVIGAPVRQDRSLLIPDSTPPEAIRWLEDRFRWDGESNRTTSAALN
jgi:hypothetical protein